MSSNADRQVPSDEELVERVLDELEWTGYSPEKLGERIGVSGRAIRNWQKGWERIESETRRKLRRYYGYPTSEPEGGVPAPESDGG